MKIKAIIFTIAILLSFLGYSSLSHAQSLCSDGKGFFPLPAPGARLTSNVGRRDIKSQPDASKFHRGTDYSWKTETKSGCGTKISGPPQGCVKTATESISGFGNVLQFDCGKNKAGDSIRVQYAHLQDSSFINNQIITGDSGIGGCHLDYIITVNGQVIDAQCSTGTVNTKVYEYGDSSTHHGEACPISGQPNLCDGNITSQLLAHSSKTLTSNRNYSIGGGGVGSPPTSPPDGPTGGGGSSGGGSGGGGGTGAGGSSGGGTPTRPNIGGGTSINDRTPDAVRPPYKFPDADADLCDTPTCLTNTMLDLANQADVMQDAITTKFLNIAGDGKCLPASATGNIVVRQGDGKTETYSDRFCMNKGCSFVEGSGCQ